MCQEEQKPQENFDSYLYTCTPADAYGKSIRIPKGFQVVAFRPPRLGELYLNLCFHVIKAQLNHRLPHLILVRNNVLIPSTRRVVYKIVQSVQEIYGGDVKIPVGWNFVHFRIPNQGEYYLSSANPQKIKVYEKTLDSSTPRIIIRVADNMEE